MKAVRFHEYGTSDVLRQEEIERPAPGPGEALIRVAATSFNAVDAGIRSGARRGPFRSPSRTPPASTSPARSRSSATGRRPPAELATVHARAEAGELSGKIVIAVGD
jgi:hypothetical protein